MSFEITGKLIAKYDTVQRSETFRTREFVLEKNEDVNGRIISNYIKFQLVQDRTTMLDRYKEGDNLKVNFNIKGSRWERDGRVNYITNLDAWRIEPVSGSGSAPAYDREPDYNTSQERFNPSQETIDDLPF